MQTHLSRVLLLAGVMVQTLGAQYAIESTQVLLEKQMFYISGGKVGQCKYWSLYLGPHECDLRRKFPGEDTAVIHATVNFALMSSGYITGTGMAENGKKVHSLTGFSFVTQDTSCKLSIDSIACAWDNCNQVRTSAGSDGYLRVDAEGKLCKPSDLLLTKFKMVNYYGEQVLRKDADVTITAFAFTKEGIQRALALQKKAAGGK